MKSQFPDVVKDSAMTPLEHGESSRHHLNHSVEGISGSGVGGAADNEVKETFRVVGIILEHE